jgi:predicted ATPase/DNA-binding winged helix-turn-helix (wHTH) protein
VPDPSAGEYSFGDFRLRPSARTLTKSGEPVRVGSRAFDLLLVLVERRERVVSKNELLELVWASVVVEENNLQVHVSTLRKLLGPAAIATLPGRGYRFTLPIETPTAVAPRPGPSTDEPSDTNPPSAPRAGAPLAPARAATNLPPNLPPLFGREAELRQVQQLVEQHHLVTIVGAAGIGKTRLALAVAHAERDHYGDGVWLVELAAVADPALALLTVAQAIGVALDGAGPVAILLVEALRHQKLLLVLDNCEHLLDGIAPFVDALMRAAPQVSLLATSQEPLKLSEEHQFRLGTLSVPPLLDEPLAAHVASHGAIALFMERARAVDPHFALTDETAPAVVDICRHLDGIALAIELAAARVSLLGVTGLRDRLGERFKVLTAGSRLALRRHQTLRAALDWSFGLLSPAEQAVFRRLGVFAGGFTLEAAQDVAADNSGIDAWSVLDHLGALVDKSLVVAGQGDVPRYLLLETTRAYALEELAGAGETPAAVKRHALAIKAVFERAEADRFGENGTLDEASFCRRLQPELDNLGAALRWATSEGGDPSVGVALVAASAEASVALGLGAEALKRHLALQRFVGPAIDEDVVARFWNGLIRVGAAGRVERDVFLSACAKAELTYRKNGQPRRLCRILSAKAWTLGRADQRAEAAAVARECGLLEDPSWPGWLRCAGALSIEAMLHTRELRFDQALAVYREMAELLPAGGEERRRLIVLGNQSYVSFCMGDFRQAIALARTVIEQLRAQRIDSQSMAYAFSYLVGALTALGLDGEARDALEEAVPYWQRTGSVTIFCDHPALLYARQGRYADAARLAGAADAFNERGGVVRGPSELRARAEVQHLLEAAQVADAQARKWEREGRGLDVDHVVALLLAGEAAAPGKDRRATKTTRPGSPAPDRPH